MYAFQTFPISRLGSLPPYVSHNKEPDKVKGGGETVKVEYLFGNMFFHIIFFPVLMPEVVAEKGEGKVVVGSD